MIEVNLLETKLEGNHVVPQPHDRQSEQSAKANQQRDDTNHTNHSSEYNKNSFHICVYSIPQVLLNVKGLFVCSPQAQFGCLNQNGVLFVLLTVSILASFSVEVAKRYSNVGLPRPPLI